MCRSSLGTSFPDRRRGTLDGKADTVKRATRLSEVSSRLVLPLVVELCRKISSSGCYRWITVKPRHRFLVLFGPSRLYYTLAKQFVNLVAFGFPGFPGQYG
jgi:hypothetical protein